MLLAASALVKPYALVLAPALLRRGDEISSRARLQSSRQLPLPTCRTPARAGTRSGTSPSTFARRASSPAPCFYLLGLLDSHPSTFATATYVVVASGILPALGVAFLRAPPGSPAEVPIRALWMFSTLFVLTAPTYPWYALLAAALLPLARGLVRVPAAAISLAAPFLYLHISVGSHPAWPRHLVYGGSAVALAAVALSAAGRARTRRRLRRSSTAAVNPSRSAARVVEAKT